MSVADIPRNPTWDTWVNRATTDGRLSSKGGSVWLYRRVPMAPVHAAKDRAAAIDAGTALATFLEALGSLTAGRNRQMAKANYREFHLLWVNVPVWFHADPKLPTATLLNQSFRDRLTPRKELVIGVRLIPSATRSTIMGTFSSVFETFTGGQRPISDFDRDYERIASVMANCGFDQLEPETLRFMQSWWTHGDPRSVPVLAHEEHIHYFTDLSSVRLVQDHFSPENCDDWTDQVGNQFPISFANLQALDIEDGDIGATSVQWAVDLATAGARVVSVRGLVEPAKITRVELRRQIKGLRGDISEADAAGKDDRAEVHDLAAQARRYETAAALGTLPATLVDTSVIIGFDGAHDEVERLAPQALRLTPMTNVQPQAWHETMIASPVRANPVLHDLSVDAIAHAGFQDRTMLGDREGALLGFTDDDQPVYVTHRMSAELDAAPLIAVFSKTGWGKTVLAQWLAYQWSHWVPVVFIDPKPGSDLSAMVEHAGGRIIRFDDLINVDGSVDPLTNFPDPVQAIPLAAKVLGTVTSKFRNLYSTMETEVTAALLYGVGQGARATGQALLFAKEAGKINPEFVDDIMEAISVEPRFRAVVGLSGETPPLRIDKGLTLFMAGDRHLDLPPRKADKPLHEEGMAVRSTVNLLRMVLRSTLFALRGTGGVTFADEAHVFERAAPDELEEAGRLAREWEESLVMMTQTPSGPVGLGLAGYFASGIIGHISDSAEARKALELFEITDPGLVPIITAEAELGGRQGFNYRTLMPLWRHKDEGRVLVRPARSLYRDLHASIAPVTIHIPEWFFKFASSNPDDRRAWRAEQASLQQEGGTRDGAAA